MTATATSSTQWLPLVLAPVAFLVWMPVIAILFAFGARGHHRPGEPAAAPRPTELPAAQTTDRPAEERRPKWGTPVDPTDHPDWQRRERHLYSAGGVNRGYVIGLVGAVGAIGAAALAVFGFPQLDPTLAAFLGAVVGWLFSLPLVWAYERALWRRPRIARFRLSKIPDLNGGWHGYIEVHKGLEGEATHERIPCRVRIKQDWSRIKVDFITDATESWSVMATLDADRVHYEYFVAPRPNPPPDSALKKVKPHFGMVRLVPAPRPGRGGRCSQLSGGWFNDPSNDIGQDTLRWGAISLQRT